MDSLLQSDQNAAIVARLESLEANANARWGKMNVAQMLTHCQRPFLVAADELKMKRGLIGLLLGRMAKKKFVTGDSPFSQNSPTDPKFVVEDSREFDREHQTLIELVTRFGESGPVTRDPHPFFGPLSREEWDRLLWKHLDHHLRQFGV